MSAQLFTIRLVQPPSKRERRERAHNQQASAQTDKDKSWAASLQASIQTSSCAPKGPQRPPRALLVIHASRKTARQRTRGRKVSERAFQSYRKRRTDSSDSERVEDDRLLVC